MAAHVRLLLGLPPCLRLQTLNPGHNALHLTKSPYCPRTFQTGPRVQQEARPRAPKPFKKAIAGKALPTIPQNVSPRSPPVLPPAYRGGPRSSISIVEPQLDRVLLYTSADHGAFFAASYITGVILLIGGYSYAQMFLKNDPDRPTQPWYIKSMGAISVLCVAGFGTAFILAPTKLIKSIAIVNQVAGAGSLDASRILRVEIKRSLPFMRPDVLETTAAKMFVDRNVPGTVEGIRFHNIPLSQAEEFTTEYFSKQTKSREGGVLATLSRANRSLLHLWPAITREVRRMFVRDQMAYVRIEGNGSFKLDLQQCHLLDGGKPLQRVVKAQDDARPSVLGWILSRVQK